MNKILILHVTSESGDQYNFAFRNKLDESDVEYFLREKLPWEIYDDELLVSWNWIETEIEDGTEE